MNEMQLVFDKAVPSVRATDHDSKVNQIHNSISSSNTATQKPPNSLEFAHECHIFDFEQEGVQVKHSSNVITYNLRLKMNDHIPKITSHLLL